MGHPLGENAETKWAYGHRNPQQRQDVRMGQVFPTDDLSTQPLDGSWTIVTSEVDRKHLEHSVGIPLVHPETFDGHGQPQVCSLAHLCEPGVAMDSPNAYELPLKNIGGGYDAVGFANLGEKQ